MQTELQTFNYTDKLMGNIFYFSFVTSCQQLADEYFDISVKEIRRIEKLLTTFNDSSETNHINHAAGIRPVKVSPEVFDLIERAQNISQLTQGAFDLSYGSLDKDLWNFNRNMTALPDPVTAKKAVRLINFRNIILDKNEQTVFLKHQGMRIGFGGIGKGYAAEQVKRLMKQLNVYGGVINASGDLAVWGKQANEKPWTIGIAAPEMKSPFSYIQINEGAVATSGNYEKFAIINGKKYSHTIDPKTGLPVNGIQSVTVLCNNAELADALTTPIMVMGVKAALHMINQLPNIHCIIIDDENNVYTSDHIQIKNVAHKTI